MSMPKGYKHTEEAKAKMRKPRKPVTPEECIRRSERQKLYTQARRAFVEQYIKMENRVK